MLWSCYTLSDTPREELFSTPVRPLAKEFKKIAARGKIRLFQKTINTPNSNGIQKQYW